MTTDDQASARPIDLLVIGGGINGTGIARDAVGRGLSVTLVERGDLAGATSSCSSKLVHGGLRYLEQYAFRLVAEALVERETLLRMAPHLVWPARFVMPHVASLRPRWMIRAGLFLYDHLGGHHADSLLSDSASVRLDRGPFHAGLQDRYRHGFIYSDCRTDDARLVIANARDAARRGARILPRTELLAARRRGSLWEVQLAGGETLQARAIANVAGPWVKDVLNRRLGVPSVDSLRLVRGSHLVLPRLYPGEHAFILQNDDRRVVFMIPYEGRFTLLGTTDVLETGDPSQPRATADEAAYLCRAAGRYLLQAPQPQDAVWRYAGVRPLYDDGSGHPSSITRDYSLRLDMPRAQADHAPVLSVFGGKLTTFRRLAEQVVDQLAAALGQRPPPWTAQSVLPGGDLPAGGLDDFVRREVAPRYPWLPESLRNGLARRHGSELIDLLGEARGPADLGEDFGGGLCERELEWLLAHEWARLADDVLWRRSKCGLHMTPQQRERVACRLGG
ncbi:MAG: glycerol-3-phosphate dehydrogenase [Betaproteobacteria bacterium]|nr:glycerol-3-phosphate dehydrogenase [Betaproteobacteria bacterium]